MKGFFIVDETNKTAKPEEKKNIFLEDRLAFDAHDQGRVRLLEFFVELFGEDDGNSCKSDDRNHCVFRRLDEPLEMN